MLGRLGILDGVRLVQIVDERGACPDRVAEVAVDDGRRVRTHDTHAFLARVGQRLLRRERRGEYAKADGAEESATNHGG